MSEKNSKRPSALHRLVKGPNFGWNLFLIIMLVAEVAIFTLKNPKFLTAAQLINAANDYILPTCFIAVFVTLVMITGGIDIQAGSIVGLTSIIIGILYQEFGFNAWVAVVIAVLAAGLCGALSGYFVAYCRVQAMVVTLGGSFLYKGLALMIPLALGVEVYKGIPVEDASFKAFTKVNLFGAIPLQVVLLAAILVIAYLLLHRSKYGRKVYLVGVNPSAAEYSGINSRLVTMSTYILSGLAAGITGVFMTSYASGAASPTYGANLTMNIITACVLGGTLSTGGKGSVLGTALASAIIGLMRQGLFVCFRIDKSIIDIPVGVLLIVVIIGRAVVNNPSVVAFFSRFKPKKKVAA